MSSPVPSEENTLGVPLSLALSDSDEECEKTDGDLSSLARDVVTNDFSNVCSESSGGTMKDVPSSISSSMMDPIAQIDQEPVDGVIPGLVRLRLDIHCVYAFAHFSLSSTSN